MNGWMKPCEHGQLTPHLSGDCYYNPDHHCPGGSPVTDADLEALALLLIPLLDRHPVKERGGR